MQTTESADGVVVAYEAVGYGQPLMLLHPSLSSSRVWHDLGYVDALANDFRLILIDARGHGESGKPTSEACFAMSRFVDDVVAALDALALQRAHLFGYSLGGRVAIACGVFAPERFTSLIVGAGSYARQTNGFDRVSYPGALETLATEGIERFLERWTEIAGFDPPAAVQETFRRCDPEVIVPYLRQMDRGPSLEHHLSAIDVPALLFAGEHDDVRLEAMRSAARMMPRAELRIVSGGNHLSTFFQTDAILEFVLPFLTNAAKLRNRSGSTTRPDNRETCPSLQHGFHNPGRPVT